MKKLTIITIVLLILISFSNPARADHMLSGRLGEPLQPMGDYNVSLVSENVVLTHDGRYSASVKGEYVLMNNGESSVIKIGILKYSYLREVDPGPYENRELRDLKINVNGSDITPEVVIIPGSDVTEKKIWYIFNVAFTEGESVTVNCEYDISLAYMESGDLSFGYFLSKNAGWAGNIGYSKITFKATNTFAYGIHSIYRELKKGFIDNVFIADLSHFTYEHIYPSGKIIYENTDYEPVDDIEIIMSNRAWPDYPNMAELRNDAKNDSVEFFKDAPFNEDDQLKALYNNLKYDTKLIETLYAKTRIDNDEDEQIPVAVKLDTDLRYGFSVYVEDSDFNFPKSCSMVALNKSGDILDTLTLDFNQQFGNYGEAVYFAYDKNSILNDINTYEVSIEDSKGNNSVTLFNSDKKIVSMVVNGNEVEVENPDTSVPIPYWASAILLVISGIVLALFRFKK